MSTRGSVTKAGATWGYYFSYTHNGKRKQIRKLGFAKQQLAQEALTKALASIDGGKLIGSEKRTVENFLTGWVNDYERSKTVKASTVETTKVHIEKYIVPILGKVKLPALDVKTIESFLGQLLNEGRLNQTAKNPKGYHQRLFTTFLALCTGHCVTLCAGVCCRLTLLQALSCQGTSDQS
jgi:hypothetical protein